MRISWKVAWILTGLGALLSFALVWLIRRPRPAPAPAPPASSIVIPQRFETAEVIFDGAFGKGWDDWGWGAHELSKDGPIKVVFAGFGGIVFRHAELPSQFGALVFRFRAPESFGEFLAVSLKYQQLGEKDLPKVPVRGAHISKLENGWRQGFVPLSALNPSQSPFDRVLIQADRAVGEEAVEIDKVVLTKPLEGAGAPIRPAKLVVDCRAPSAAINPLIYGISHGPITAGETAHRVGGNTMTRHNWQLGAWNAGSDWFFENVKVNDRIFDWLKDAPRDALNYAVVVPMIGWVAKDGTSASFPKAKFGQQRKHDPERPEMGDGHRPDGTPLAPGPPDQTSIPAPPELIKSWIEAFRKKDGESGGRSIDMYILDNEPDLWHVTHRDVHPEPLSYDELLERTIKYGEAIRAADPDGIIAGPSSWGWTGYLFSPKDSVAGVLLQSDRLSHGGAHLLPWYLAKLAEHERTTGQRILDVLNVHFYPQAPGVYESNGQGKTDPESVALRLRSTRALWDPDYMDESWIKDRVRLIPRLKQWVEKNYPGRGICIGEWSFGADEHISGALASVEALGRFGQQGLTCAYYWGKVKHGSPVFWAFRAFRNFDGQGGRFLDRSLVTTAPPELSLFASTDAAKSRIVAIAINLDPNYVVDAEIDISSCGTAKSKRVFAYGQGSQTLAEQKPGTGARQKLLPHSFSVIEITLEP